MPGRYGVERVRISATCCTGRKILSGEYVSIIQHPGGAPKAVAVRENQMIGVFESYLHYVTDTSLDLQVHRFFLTTGK